VARATDSAWSIEVQRALRLKGFNAGRLRLLLVVLFLALSVPTAALIWQAYGQLKWEAYYQYRGLAEELANRLDERLMEQVNAAEARASSDYAFLVVSGDPAANFLQRSPLSGFPVAEDVPGLIGYFQVDSNGGFSTPLLPLDEAASDKLGISPAELDARRNVANGIRTVLAENRLVRERSQPGRNISLDALKAAAPASPVPEEDLSLSEADSREYSQRVFDELNQAAPPQAASSTGGEVAVPRKRADEPEGQMAYSKVADLKLDASLQKKSESLEQESTRENEKKKQSPPAAEGARITSFASEVDPFEFSMLDSGHLVLYRKVWREGERLIQGLLIDPDVFFRVAIESGFRASLLSGMSDLVVGYQDDVMRVFRGGDAGRYASNPAELQGTLLYQGRLSAPFGGLALIFSINRLPPGPGADVLRWIALVIGLVFLGGFLFLYRLGLGQIQLARQQQDFVSAVSHELKTPLTSIRMYSEMLKEGWVDEEKRQQYYQYISTESERLTRLIANVLRLAKITHSESGLDLKPRSLRELLDQVESRTASQVEQAGFSLDLRRDESLQECRVKVDEDSFIQIIINLVDNAIKFSRKADNKTIEIGCQRSGTDELIFTVRDFGPGIARDQLKKIFQLFYRSESELTRETVGTGIGLAIVHHLTLAMQGKVDVINRDPGAEFRVSLPEYQGIAV
jgi:signal transduction histidine kinase